MIRSGMIPCSHQLLLPEEAPGLWHLHTAIRGARLAQAGQNSNALINPPPAPKGGLSLHLNRVPLCRYEAPLSARRAHRNELL